MTWIGMFSVANDHVGVQFDKQALAEKLVAAGYIRNAEVGNDPLEIADSTSRQAAWVIGQVIDGLMMGHYVHPVATRFVARYLEMKLCEGE